LPPVAVALAVPPPAPANQPGMTIPDLTGNARLALDTTLRFGEAIEQGDLAGFRAGTTPAFQQAFSLSAFERAFKGFIEQRINLLAVRDMQPQFTNRELTLDDGSLHLAGWFPTRPSRLNFDYRYSQMDGDWRLSGINVKVVPQP